MSYFWCSDERNRNIQFFVLKCIPTSRLDLGTQVKQIQPTKENHDVCKANDKPKFQPLDTKNMGTSMG